MSDFVCGANEADFHLTGVNWGRDLPEPDVVADIRNVVAGDPSPDGKGVLAIERGIEVGHVFQLGTKYSQGDERHLPRRGRQAAAAGDGLLRHRRHAHRSARRSSRTTTSAASSGRDAIAPFDGRGLPDRLRPQRRRCKAAADKLHDELLRGRHRRAARRPRRAPGRDVRRLGADRRAAPRRDRRDRGLKEGKVEYQGRRDAAPRQGAAGRARRGCR